MTTDNITFRGIVIEEQYAIIMEYYVSVGAVMSLLGVISNIINIKTFIVMGLTDGMTVSFLALSIVDLSYLVASFSLGISVSLCIIEGKSIIRFPIDPYAIAIIFGNLMIMMSVTNVLTTTFLAVARCMCVARPLSFKNTFSGKKTTNYIIAFAVFAVVSYTPVFANMGIVHGTDIKTNITRPVLWVSRNRESIKVIIWMLLDMVLPFTTQVVIVICIVVMASSLRASTRFRQMSSIQQAISRNCNDISIAGEKSKQDFVSNKIIDKMADKEIRVVQQVVLISLVYALCNTPRIIISIVGAIVPEFAPGNRYNNFYLIVNALRKHFETFNAATNTVIYYKYNTKFRTKMLL